MATVDKDIAEKLIKRCRNQKKPRIYCIARYQNTEFNKECYSICYRRKDYDGLRFSSAVGEIKILWGSEKYAIDKIIKTLDREYEEIITKQDDQQTARLIKKHQRKHKNS